MIYSNPALEKRFSINGVFDTRPKGVMICDSWNNGSFKFEQTALDTAQPDWPRVWNEYLKKYSLVDRAMFFPTHFVIDTINNLPQVIATRPLSYKSLMPDYEEWITVMIIGDSNRDIYTPRFYMSIADFIINPIFRGIQSWKMVPQLNKNVILHNLGSGFVPQMLDKYLK